MTVVSSLSLSSDLEQSSLWGSNKHVTFNASKTSVLSVPLKRHSFSFWFFCFEFHRVCFPGLSISCSLCWSSFTSKLGSSAVRKVGFLFRVRRFFTPSHLLHKAQKRPAFECSSQTCGRSTSFSPVDRVRIRFIRLIDDLSLQSTGPPSCSCLANRFYHYCFGLFPLELASQFLFLYLFLIFFAHRQLVT